MEMLQLPNPNPLITKYVYPLLGAVNEEQLIRRMIIGVFVYSFAVLLYPMPANYGRHSKSPRWGVPVRLAWLLQESPSFVVPVLLAGSGTAYSNVANQICLGLFLMHYFQRSFIYPLLITSKQSVPLLTFLLSFLTCLYNGVLHGVFFANYHVYDDDWLWTPNFVAGIAMYFVGMKINIEADSTLRRLRLGSKDGEYKIPEGGMFKYVSCANYLGEMIEMWGYAIASSAPPAIAHAVFTSVFLSRRALQHHSWYQEKFKDYPQERMAILPYML